MNVHSKTSWIMASRPESIIIIKRERKFAAFSHLVLLQDMNNAKAQ